MPRTKKHSVSFKQEDGNAIFEDSAYAESSKIAAGAAGAPGPLPGLGAPLERPDVSVDALIDELLEAGGRGREQIAGPGGLIAQFTRRVIERALETELTDHLGYQPGDKRPEGAQNARNGRPAKTLVTDHGPLRIHAPRDRDGSFEPKLVGKRQTRWPEFDDKIIALYARGLSTREIQRFLADMYGTDISPELISKVTDAVLEDAKQWQTRPLEQIYAVLYLDALVIKIRDGNAVRNFAVYIAVGVGLDGLRSVLGFWIQRTEGAKFWLQVLTELKQRGVQDVLVCCVDGLTGFPDAIEAVYPHAWVQTCVVHQVRNSLRFVAYKDRRAVAGDLKKIYTAIDRDHAETQLEAFAERWDAKYPSISSSWIENWERIVPFLAFPQDLRRIVYTTNPIEALNRQLRKIIKTRGAFPTEDAARKLLYLAIVNAEQTWKPTYNWTAALAALKIRFGDRLPDLLINT